MKQANRANFAKKNKHKVQKLVAQEKKPSLKVQDKPQKSFQDERLSEVPKDVMPWLSETLLNLTPLPPVITSLIKEYLKNALIIWDHVEIEPEIMSLREFSSIHYCIIEEEHPHASIGVRLGVLDELYSTYRKERLKIPPKHKIAKCLYHYMG